MEGGENVAKIVYQVELTAEVGSSLVEGSSLAVAGYVCHNICQIQAYDSESFL